MNEMLEHIFGDINRQNRVINKMHKHICAYEKANLKKHRAGAIAIVGLDILLLMAWMEIWKQQSELEAVKAQLEALEKQADTEKGE